MVDKQVSPSNHLAKLFRKEMVPDIHISQTGGYSRSPAQSGEKNRLVLTVPIAPFEYCACLVVLTKLPRRIGIVLDLIPDEIEEGNNLLSVCLQPLSQGQGSFPDRPGIAVNNLCIFQALLYLSYGNTCL
jgi:hypothetical protein